MPLQVWFQLEYIAKGFVGMEELPCYVFTVLFQLGRLGSPRLELAILME